MAQALRWAAHAHWLQAARQLLRNQRRRSLQLPQLYGHLPLLLRLLCRLPGSPPLKDLQGPHRSLAAEALQLRLQSRLCWAAATALQEAAALRPRRLPC